MTDLSRGFARVRQDHRAETAEDYVELIYRLEPSEGEGVRTADLVQALGVSQPTVTKALDRLRAEGVVAMQPRGRVHLTPEGRIMAERSFERHEVVVEFLRAIGVPGTHAEFDAEGIEHHVSEVTLTAMRAFLRGMQKGSSGTTEIK